jgi:hydroxypyruvate reductase
VADRTSFADALAILQKYAIMEPPQVLEHLRAAADETPKPGDPRLARSEVRMIATPQMALEAAAAVALEAGVRPLILGDAIEGESRDVAMVHAGIARQVLRHRQPVPAPCVLLSGGETTVTVRGQGRGGRNVEYLLAEAIAADGAAGIWGLSADTDGVDGAEDIAGAVFTPDTLSRARAKGRDPQAMLDDNDGHGFFELLGDSLVTGPTRTNVNDFRVTLVAP